MTESERRVGCKEHEDVLSAGKDDVVVQARRGQVPARNAQISAHEHYEPHKEQQQAPHRP